MAHFVKLTHYTTKLSIYLNLDWVISITPSFNSTSLQFMHSEILVTRGDSYINYTVCETPEQILSDEWTEKVLAGMAER